MTEQYVIEKRVLSLSLSLSHTHTLSLSLTLTLSLSFSPLQRIRATMDSEERKRLLTEHDVNTRMLDCPHTVTFYGAFFWEVRDSISTVRTLLRSMGRSSGR